MSVQTPGPRLYSSIPFKHLGGHGQGGRKEVFASLNLTAMVDMMTMLVVFLLSSFSASGEILMSQKGLDLPQGVNDAELKRAPIIVVTSDTVTFNGEPVADPRVLMEDQSMEWRVVDLFDRLRIEKTQFELSNLSEDEKMSVRGTLILQADKTVEAKVLNRIMKTAYAAEYPNIMFAINRRSKGGH